MTTTTARHRSMMPVYAILLISIAPVVFALLAYYAPSLGLRPPSKPHYGQLIEPQREIPKQLSLHELDGKPYDLNQLKGQWILLSTGPGACPEACVRGLFVLRNSHASQGKEVDRINRILLVTDDAPVAPVVAEAYVGTHVLRADPAQLAAWLVPDAADPTAALSTGMWIIDPLGHLMMMFPDGQDPEGVRDDIRVLLKNSRIG
ncbi:SCO family protein [Castellaniella sp.]|uniref:SCO family protein n=1 Tax=Castellaniella sp. TaxID=1955812 RepID=UPI003A940147